MAGASLLTLLDDITAILDDVALMSKVAAKKTAGVLGDDLALNAQQVNGVAAERELPIVWKVFKGSAVNKAIIIPVALGLSAFAPWAITPLLMAGGLYLCYEGSEKVLHTAENFLIKKGILKSSHSEVYDPDHEYDEVEDMSKMTPEQLKERENAQVKGAIRTDFILSAEIVVIALGTMAAAPILSQIVSLSAVGALMTVGVYGAVAGIVKMDDVGLWLKKKESPLAQSVGDALVKGMAPLMKGLTIAGTVAMFMVGGSILAHAIPAVAHLGGVTGFLAEIGVGIGAGLAAVGGHKIYDMIRDKLVGDDAKPAVQKNSANDEPSVESPESSKPEQNKPSRGVSMAPVPSLQVDTPSHESSRDHVDMIGRIDPETNSVATPVEPAKKTPGMKS